MMIIRWQHCIFKTTRLMLFSNPIAMFFIHFLSKQLGLSIMINIRVIYSFLSLNIPGSMTISGRRFAGVVANQYKPSHSTIQIVLYDVENGLDYIYEDFHNNVDAVEYYASCVWTWYIAVGIVLSSLCVSLFSVSFYAV